MSGCSKFSQRRVSFARIDTEDETARGLCISNEKSIDLAVIAGIEKPDTPLEVPAATARHDPIGGEINSAGKKRHGIEVDDRHNA
jgi:hypothetical protein